MGQALWDVVDSHITCGALDFTAERLTEVGLLERTVNSLGRSTTDRTHVASNGARVWLGVLVEDRHGCKRGSFGVKVVRRKVEKHSEVVVEVLEIQVRRKLMSEAQSTDLTTSRHLAHGVHFGG